MSNDRELETQQQLSYGLNLIQDLNIMFQP